MLARDRQKPEEAAAAVAVSAGNPLREASRAPPTGRALREATGGAGLIMDADALALVYTKSVTLHSLTDADADPLLLVDNSAGSALVSSTASPDGVALRLGDNAGWLAVYDVAALRVEQQPNY